MQKITLRHITDKVLKTKDKILKSAGGWWWEGRDVIHKRTKTGITIDFSETMQVRRHRQDL